MQFLCNTERPKRENRKATLDGLQPINPIAPLEVHLLNFEDFCETKGLKYLLVRFIGEHSNLSNTSFYLQQDCAVFRFHYSDYLLQLLQGIMGYICGSEGLDSSGVSSSAAVSLPFPFTCLCSSMLRVEIHRRQNPEIVKISRSQLNHH